LKCFPLPVCCCCCCLQSLSIDNAHYINNIQLIVLIMVRARSAEASESVCELIKRCKLPTLRCCAIACLPLEASSVEQVETGT
jgi:hypothetical protein